MNFAMDLLQRLNSLLKDQSILVQPADSCEPQPCAAVSVTTSQFLAGLSPEAARLFQGCEHHPRQCVVQMPAVSLLASCVQLPCNQILNRSLLTLRSMLLPFPTNTARSPANDLDLLSQALLARSAKLKAHETFRRNPYEPLKN